MAPASRLMGWPFLLAWGAHALRRAPAPCAARSILAPAARVRRLAAAARPATACAAASDGRGSADGAAGSAEAPLYLIDALPLIYRGYYGIRGPTGSGAALSTEAGEETTALFGFVSQLAAFLSEHEPSRLVVRSSSTAAHATQRSSPPCAGRAAGCAAPSCHDPAPDCRSARAPAAPRSKCV